MKPIITIGLMVLLATVISSCGHRLPRGHYSQQVNYDNRAVHNRVYTPVHSPGSGSYQDRYNYSAHNMH